MYIYIYIYIYIYVSSFLHAWVVWRYLLKLKRSTARAFRAFFL